MYRFQLGHGFPSVIARNLYSVRMPVPPRKTHPELVIDPYGMLPDAISRQPMQLVPRRHFQIVKLARGMEHIQFPSRHILNGSPFLDALVVEQSFDILGLKRLDHKYSI
jgi:hypothetical protein